VKRDIGLFWLNVQVRPPLVPVLHFAVGARAAGHDYPDSAGAILAGYLGRVAAPWVPAVIGGLLAAVGVARLVLAARSALARIPRRAAVMRGARVVERRALGPWSVPVIVSASRAGVPFAAGILRPYVCFPAAAYEALSPAERDAVVQHELAHHRAGDLFALAVVGAARAFFWFLPGLGWLARELRSQCELCADASAVAHGAEPHALASALVRVAELALPAAHAAPALAFGQPEPVIARRVRQLLDDARSSSRIVFLARAAGLAMFALGVFRATTLGYH
jgi:beta-lactamase regulating signal transducer with metallopeptidase domain